METVTNSRTVAPPVKREDLRGLASLLERIKKTDGEIPPNDRAVAGIYAGYLRQQCTRARKNDRVISR